MCRVAFVLTVYCLFLWQSVFWPLRYMNLKRKTYIVRASSTPTYSPALSETILPQPSSLAGVPSSCIRLGIPKIFNSVDKVMRIVRPAVATRLCPPAWPTQGSTSYSGWNLSSGPQSQRGPRKRSELCTWRVTVS